MREPQLLSRQFIDKIFYFSISACFLLVVGCGGTSNSSAPTAVAPPVTTTPKVTTIYVAGSTQYGTVQIATLWKNSVPFQLGQSGFVSYSHALALSGTDVYVAGVQSDGVQMKPLLWKNGVATTLTTTTGYGIATGVAISGSDVYVSGYSLGPKGEIGIGYLWKNSNATILSGTSNANSVAVSSSGDIYVATVTFNFYATPFFSGGVWKNGTLSPLPGSEYAQQIVLSGTDVYVAGNGFPNAQTTSSVPTYWKNGTPTFLSTSPGFLFAVNPTTQGLYAAGLLKGPAATLWKDGVAEDYNKTNTRSELGNLTVFDGSLYVVGITDKGATLWTDGTPTYFDSSSKDSTANALVIVQQ